MSDPIESITITGTVIKLEAPQVYGSKSFRKALCVVKTEDEKYPQSIPVESTGKRADIFTEANIAEGDVVTISANLQGREWQGRYFLSLGAWKVELESEGLNEQPANQRADRPPIADLPELPDYGDESIPF